MAVSLCGDHHLEAESEGAYFSAVVGAVEFVAGFCLEEDEFRVGSESTVEPGELAVLVSGDFAMRHQLAKNAA